MRGIYLVPFLFSLVQASTYLRRSSSRDLQATRKNEQVPFKATLDIRVSDKAAEITPAQANYDGLLAAFQSWFHENSVEFYTDNADFEGLTYVETDCELLQAEGNNTSVVRQVDHQHSIAMLCESTFEVEETTDAVSSITLAREASLNYDFRTFVSGWIVPLAPAGGVFRDSRSVKITMVGSQSNPPGPSTSTDSTTTLPTTTNTTNANITISVPTIAPDGASSGNHSTNSGPTVLGTIDVILEWTMSVTPIVVRDRQPTQEEYDAFMEQSEAFIGDVFSKYFTPNQTEVAHFTGNMNSTIRSTSFNASAEHPHTIVIQSDVEFARQANEDFPSMILWVLALREEGVATFRTDYLGSEPGIFSDLSFIQWRALME